MISALRDLAEGYIFDPSFIDLVVWFPHLSWAEFMASLATVIGWRWVSDRIERACTLRLRRVIAAGLLKAALWIRPRTI